MYTLTLVIVGLIVICGAFWHNRSARREVEQREDLTRQAADFEALLPRRKAPREAKKSQ